MAVFSCSFSSNIAKKNVGCCFFLEDSNSNFSFSNSLFRQNNASGGSIVYFSRANSNFLFFSCTFSNNTSIDGGVFAAEYFNVNINFSFCILSENYADRGGVIFANSENFFSFSDSSFSANLAKMAGGIIFFSKNCTASFFNNRINQCASLIFGAIIYANETSFVNFSNCIFTDTSSRIGAVSIFSCLLSTFLLKSFYVGFGSLLRIFNTTFSKFYVAFKPGEVIVFPLLTNSLLFCQKIMRLDGPKVHLDLSECLFKVIEDVFLSDYSLVGNVSLTNCKFVFHSSYSIKGILHLVSESTKYFLRENSFYFLEKTLSDFDYFIQLGGNRSSLYFHKNWLNFNLFPIVFSCNSLLNNNITVSGIQLIKFPGVLLKSHISHREKHANSAISILNCKFEIYNSSSHFVDLNTHTNFILNKTYFYIDCHNIFSLLYSKTKGTTEKHVLNIDSCMFLQLRTSGVRFTQKNSPSFSMIQSENGWNKISLSNSIIQVGLVFFSSILHFEGNLNITLKSAIIYNNVLNYSKSHLILIKFQRPPLINVSGSKISYNRVVMGGFLSMEGLYNSSQEFSLILKNNTVSYNFAVNKGGFLYINVSWINQNSLSKYLESLSDYRNYAFNIFRKNNAAIGSFIFWEGLEVPPLNNLSVIEKALLNDNTKKSSLFEKGSSINFVRISNFDDFMINSAIFANQSLFRVDRKVVKNKLLFSGFYFCFLLYDKYDRNIYLTSENYLNANFGDKKSMIPSLIFDKINVSFLFTKGKFCANKFNFQLKYSEVVGRNFTLKFESQIFLQFFELMNKSKLSNFSIEFLVDKCKIAEFFDGETCAPCEINKFSLSKELTSLTDCKFCTDFDKFYCYGGSLRSPKKNFWRLGINSTRFLRCPVTSCLGDEQFLRNQSFRSCLNCFLPASKGEELFFSFSENFSAKGNCSKPYLGYLCTQCQAGFGSLGLYRCGDCSTSWVYIRQFLIIATKVCLFFFANWKALKAKMNTNKGSTKEFIDNIKSAFLLKIMFKHFAILGLLKTLPFDINEKLDESFSAVISVSPSENFDVFSFECLLQKMGILLPPVYFKTIINLVFFSLSLIFLTLALYLTQEKGSKTKLFQFLQTNLQGICFIFFLDNIISILDPYLKILFVTNTGDEDFHDSRLLSDFSLNSWDNLHKFFVFYFSFPCILIFAIFIPLLSLTKILFFRHKNKLDDPSFLRALGYFIYPYNRSAVYFEFFSIYNKLILILFANILRLSVLGNEQISYLLLFFIYLIAFYLFQSNLSPYKQEKFSVLQKVELSFLSVSISNALCAIVWTLSEDLHQSLLNWIIFTFVLLSNIIFFLVWFHKYFHFLREKLKAMIRTFKYHFKNLFKSKGEKKLILRKSLINEADYKELYREALEKIKDLEIEKNRLIKIINQHKKTIDFLRENNEIISQEASPAKNIITTEDLITNKRTNKLAQIRKGNISSRDLNKSPNFEVISKSPFGDGLHDFCCEIKLSINENLMPLITIQSVKSLSSVWIVNPWHQVVSSCLLLSIFHKDQWVEPPFENLIGIQIFYELNSGGVSKRQQKRSDIVKVTLNLEDFLRVEQLEWEMMEVSSVKTSSNLIFELQLSALKLAEIFKTKGNPPFLQAEVLVRSEMRKSTEFNFIVFVDQLGCLKAFGHPEPGISNFLRYYFMKKY